MPGFSSCKQTEKRDCDRSEFSWTIHCLGPRFVIDTVTENKQNYINGNQIKHHPKVSSQSKDHRTVTARSTLPLTMLNIGCTAQLGSRGSTASRPPVQIRHGGARKSRHRSAVLPTERVSEATSPSQPSYRTLGLSKAIARNAWIHPTHPNHPKKLARYGNDLGLNSEY